MDNVKIKTLKLDQTHAIEFALYDKPRIKLIDYGNGDEYYLEERDADYILRMRIRTNVVGFVLRFNQKYYFADLGSVQDIRVDGAFARHLCGDCKRCIASEDGCPKVRDFYLSGTSRKRAAFFNKRIEKYDFIVEGIEIFNNGNNSWFSVRTCKDFVFDDGSNKCHEIRKRLKKPNNDSINFNQF